MRHFRNLTNQGAAFIHQGVATGEVEAMASDCAVQQVPDDCEFGICAEGVH